MNLSTYHRKAGTASVRQLATVTISLLIPILLMAAGPQWWTDRNVTNSKQANDYAAVNQGQLKNLAKAAVAEMDARLPGGAGDVLHALIARWATPTSSTNDYAAVNLGQLKNLAKPFYDRLIAVHYATRYPWEAPGHPPANDYAMANIGQVKNLFSFDFTATDTTHDTDQNGIPDWWELYYFGHIGIDPNSDADGDGLTNLQEFQSTSNPLDYYNGFTPVVSKTFGNNQSSLPGAVLSQPLMIQLTGSDGIPLPNAPVRFSVFAGGGFLAADPGTQATQTFVDARTDDEGAAWVFYRSPSQGGVQSQVACVAGPNGSTTFTFHAKTVSSSPPANDNFANALLITGAQGTAQCSSPGATKEQDEPNHGVLGTSAQSVWFRWVAPVSGPVVLDTHGSSYDTVCAAYTGSALANLALLNKNDDSLDSSEPVFTSQVSFVAAAGTTYYIAVDSEEGQTGEVALHWAPSAAPSNDLFAAAQVLSGTSGNLVATNANASTEFGEPLHAKQPGGASVWYRWQAPSNGVFALTTAGSTFDTLIGVYTGSSIGTLTEIVSNDNENADVKTSQAQFSAIGGVTYYIAIDGYSGANGNLQAAWHFESAAPNDNFSAAVVLSGTSGSVNFTTYTASHEPSEPDHASANTTASVWYEWQADASGYVSFYAESDMFQPVCAVYSGEQLDSLTSIAASSYGSAWIYAEAGATYYIAIDGADHSSGDGIFSWNQTVDDSSGSEATQAMSVARVTTLQTTNKSSIPPNYDLQQKSRLAATGATNATALDEEECDDPPEANRGDAGVWDTDENGDSVFLSAQEVFLSIPGNPSPNPNLENTCTEDIPVTHRIVTVNTPRARDLTGVLRLNLKQGDASALEITYNGNAYALGTDIPVKETGHWGCGVHDWHTGTETFGFKGKKGGDVVLEAVVDPDADDGGDGQPNQKLTITVHVIKVTFKAKPSATALPYAISAKTDWDEQEAATTKQQITVETDPPEYAPQIELKIEGFDSDINPAYQPADSGSIARPGGSGAVWEYTAFTEPKTEKHPKDKTVLIRAYLNDQLLCAKHKANVTSVFNWLAWAAHKHGFDGTAHILPTGADRVEDRNKAAKYVVWKYSVPVGNIHYSYALSGPESDNAVGYTKQTDPKGSRTVLIYPGAYTTENWLASVIGHENVHGGQDIGFWIRRAIFKFTGKWYKQIEYPAYQWEVDHADDNGLSDDEKNIIKQNRDNTKQGNAPTTGE